MGHFISEAVPSFWFIPDLIILVCLKAIVCQNSANLWSLFQIQLFVGNSGK